MLHKNGRSAFAQVQQLKTRLLVQTNQTKSPRLQRISNELMTLLNTHPEKDSSLTPKERGRRILILDSMIYSLDSYQQGMEVVI